MKFLAVDIKLGGRRGRVVGKGIRQVLLLVQLVVHFRTRVDDHSVVLLQVDPPIQLQVAVNPTQVADFRFGGLLGFKESEEARAAVFIPVVNRAQVALFLGSFEGEVFHGVAIGDDDGVCVVGVPAVTHPTVAIASSGGVILREFYITHITQRGVVWHLVTAQAPLPRVIAAGGGVVWGVGEVERCGEEKGGREGRGERCSGCQEWRGQ